MACHYACARKIYGFGHNALLKAISLRFTINIIKKIGYIKELYVVQIIEYPLTVLIQQLC